MSQQKVEEKKEQKLNMKKNVKRRKIGARAGAVIGIVVAVFIAGWLIYSAHSQYLSYRKNNPKTYTVDLSNIASFSLDDK